MKRFWLTVRAEQGPEGFAVLLDDKPVRLPSGRALTVRSAALARALAEEWAAVAGGRKDHEFGFDDLPLTRLVGTGLDRIAPDPHPTIDAIAQYGQTDLLCYRAGHPVPLAARQHALWQPLLDWAEFTFGAPLHVTDSLIPIDQHPLALAALKRAVAAHQPIALSALGLLVQSTGSLVLGLAVSRGRIGADQAHALASLDESFQREQWGEDEEATKRLEGVAGDIALAARVLRLANEGAGP